MMQQPVFQQEQAGNQVQQQQQMLLCPVRLVYETQILVQPGDQIQPNQTIVINPQNQPPWAQNRVQNQQVIYVQNVPNNFMPQVHQLEQNQMFLQQNYGFPQVIQHPMITQNQEQIRTLQMGNVPANMQSQVQANIAQIMPNERMVTHNFGHVHVNPGINVPSVVQNQLANVPISANNRQIQSVPKTVTEMPNNSQKPHEVQISTQQNYRHLSHHPISQQMNLARAPTHQAIAMIPVPNMVHRPSNLEPNNVQISSMPQQAIAQTSNQMPPTFASSAQNVQIEPRKGVPIMHKGLNQNMPNTVNHTPKNQAYTYRPIQPRPQHFRSTVPTNAMTVQPNMNIQIQSNQNIIDGNRITQNITNPNYQKIDNNNHQFNKKRKSESPDEIQRKITIVQASHPTSTHSMTVKRIDNPNVSHSVSVTKVNTHEVGVNTTPVMKINQKISTNNRNMIQISPLVDQHAKIKEELAKPIYSVSQTAKPPIVVTNITNNNPLPNINASSQVEREKLVRNTVYTQARFGRILTDKEDVPMNTNSPITKEAKNVETQKDNIAKEVLITENVSVSEIKSVENKITTRLEHTQEVKKEETTKSTQEVREEKSEIIERCAEEKMLSDSMSRLKGTEANELKLKNEKDYILTHVLDGFVIQESNVAFPIRLPLKEKTLGMNTGLKAKANIKREDLSEERDVKQEKVPDLSHLNISENERLKTDNNEKELKINEGNPFTELKHSAVKSWTVEQLSIHLAKFNWLDTISVLREHEIDGESLFLVSKSQLVSIGVKENHADVICEFVKS